MQVLSQENSSSFLSKVVWPVKHAKQSKCNTTQTIFFPFLLLVSKENRTKVVELFVPSEVSFYLVAQKRQRKGEIPGYHFELILHFRREVRQMMRFVHNI